jgi:lactoylglutathione lyase
MLLRLRSTRVKHILGMTAAVLLIVSAVAISDDKPAAKPAGLSLRLELFVAYIEKSVDFYTKVLGFERLDGESDYVPVRSGSVVIGLGPAKGLPKFHHFNPEVQTARRGLGAELVLEVDDVDAYFQKVKDSGYKILTPLRKRPWGATDFRIADPDGYYLRITSR